MGFRTPTEARAAEELTAEPGGSRFAAGHEAAMFLQRLPDQGFPHREKRAREKRTAIPSGKTLGNAIVFPPFSWDDTLGRLPKRRVC